MIADIIKEKIVILYNNKKKIMNLNSFSIALLFLMFLLLKTVGNHQNSTEKNIYTMIVINLKKLINGG